MTLNSDILKFENLKTNEILYTDDINSMKYNSFSVLSTMVNTIKEKRNDIINKYQGKLIRKIDEVETADEVFDTGVYSKNDFVNEYIDLKVNIISHLFNSKKDKEGKTTKGTWAGDPIKISLVKNEDLKNTEFGKKAYEDAFENYTLFPKKNDTDYVLVNLNSCSFFDPKVEVMNIHNSFIKFDPEGKVLKRLKGGNMLNNKTSYLMIDYLFYENNNNKDGMKIIAIDMKDHGYEDRLNTILKDEHVKKYCTNKNIEVTNVTPLLHLSVSEKK